MSVLACERRGCSNIMCENTILGDKYYICDECLEELNGAKLTWKTRNKREIIELVEEFMDSEKDSYEKYYDIDDVIDLQKRD